MPRVPQILATGETGGTPAGARLDPEAFAQLTTSGIRTGARALGNAADQYQKVYSTLQTEQAKLEAEMALGEFQRQYADADIGLKNDPSITPDQYSQRVDQSLRAIREGVSKTLRTPGARSLFERSGQRFATEQSIKGKYEGLERLHASVKAGTDITLRQDERDAVFGPPELRDAAIQRGLARIQGLTQTRILSGTEANARSTAFLAAIEEGSIRLNARDPLQREEVIDNLVNGRYPTLTVDRQLDLADGLMRQTEAQREKQEKKDKDAAEATRKARVDELDGLAERGELTSAQVEQAIKDRVAIDDDARRLRSTVRQGGAAGGRTDDEVYNRLELDLLSNPRSHSPGEIRRIQTAGKLAASGPRSAASLLKLIRDEDTEAKDITSKPLFKQGLHELRQSLRGGVGPLESLTREAATRLENAEREYHDLARSTKISQEQLPEIARRIVDRVRRAAPLMMGDPEPRTTLRYQTAKDLLDAKAAGVIPDSEFNRQFNLMKSLGMFNAPVAPAGGAEQPQPGKKPGGGR